MTCQCLSHHICEECELGEMAVVCPKCGQYYPYDCFVDGCKDVACKCDGCETMRHIERG